MFDPHEAERPLNLDSLGFEELGRTPTAGAADNVEIPELNPRRAAPGANGITRELLANDFDHGI